MRHIEEEFLRDELQLTQFQYDELLRKIHRCGLQLVKNQDVTNQSAVADGAMHIIQNGAGTATPK